jgi:hypothetical protein
LTLAYSSRAFLLVPLLVIKHYMVGLLPTWQTDRLPNTQDLEIRICTGFSGAGDPDNIMPCWYF